MRTRDNFPKYPNTPRITISMKTSSFRYPEIVDILLSHAPCVLATVIQTHGSTPQKAGSSAITSANQLLAGTVGGGITELKVIKKAQIALEAKVSEIFSIDLSGDITKGSESICGGGMTVLLDTSPELHLPVFLQLDRSLKERQKGVLMTLVEETYHEKIKISRHWFSTSSQPPLPVELRNKIEPVINEMLEKLDGGSCRLIPLKELEIRSDGFIFLERILPKPSLIIAGAGHIGQSLVQLGKFLDFKVTVWDDRPEFANQTLIPDADSVLSGSIDSVVDKLHIRDDSYLVIVTRGHKHDAEVLRKFISLDLAYIGIIGSKAKASQMRMTFLDNGWATPDQWDRIFTPIGLDIGAQSVEEIALSIAAQLVKVRNLKYTPQ